MNAESDLHRAKVKRNGTYYRMQAASEDELKARSYLDQATQEHQDAYAHKNQAHENLELALKRLRSVQSSLGQQKAGGASSGAIKRTLRRLANAYNSRDDYPLDDCTEQNTKQRARSPNRKDLASQIKSAKSKLNEAGKVHRQAEAKLSSAEAALKRAKRSYSYANTELERAKQAAIDWNLEYLRLLEIVDPQKADVLKLNMERADKAGVPREYHGNLYVSAEENGNINILFGGKKKPNGEDHGHYVLDKFGNVVYAREIGAERPPEHIRKAAAERKKGIHSSTTDSY